METTTTKLVTKTTTTETIATETTTTKTTIADYKCGPYQYYQQPAGSSDTDSKSHFPTL